MKKQPVRNTILTIYKEPGQEPIVRNVENELKAFQELVGGYIEVVQYKDGIIIICNEEGYLLGMKPNVFGICGPVIVCRTKGEEFASLSGVEIMDLVRKDFVER